LANLHPSPHRHGSSSSTTPSSSPTPPKWSLTLPILPSARAHVRAILSWNIGGSDALTLAQRSTGAMRRGGLFTATGTGCGRYVINSRIESLAPMFLYDGATHLTFDWSISETGVTKGRRDIGGQGWDNRGLTQIVQAPEVQTMYSLNLPVSTLRTKIRQEFERHRYVNQLRTIDVLLFFSHQEYQVRKSSLRTPDTLLSNNPALPTKSGG
jgi:hypothetical protein